MAAHFAIFHLCDAFTFKIVVFPLVSNEGWVKRLYCYTLDFIFEFQISYGTKILNFMVLRLLAEPLN